MDVIVAIAVISAMAALAITRARRHRRRDRINQAPAGPGVLLSVLPSRTAVVTLDVKSHNSAAAVASLVDEAVRDAFALASVDDVEVRSADGELLDRPCRPELGWPARADLHRPSGPESPTTAASAP